MIYTSHWRSPLLDDVDAVIVSISRGQPRWPLAFKYRKLMDLAPSREAFGIEVWEEFDAAYLAGLDELGPDRIVAELQRISEEAGGRPLVMLCWEQDPADCHRGLLARWLLDRAGIVVPELEPGMLPLRPDAPQPSLFDEAG